MIKERLKAVHDSLEELIAANHRWIKKQLGKHNEPLGAIDMAARADDALAFVKSELFAHGPIHRERAHWLTPDDEAMAKLAALPVSVEERVWLEAKFRLCVQQQAQLVLNDKAEAAKDLGPTGWIIWNPESKKPPTRVFTTYSEATLIAAEMAQKHPYNVFHVCRFVASVSNFSSGTLSNNVA